MAVDGFRHIVIDHAFDRDHGDAVAAGGKTPAVRHHRHDRKEADDEQTAEDCADDQNPRERASFHIFITDNRFWERPARSAFQDEQKAIHEATLRSTNEREIFVLLSVASWMGLFNSSILRRRSLWRRC